MFKSFVTWTLGLSSCLLLAQGTQIPPPVQAELNTVKDRFFAVLEEECPGNVCFPVGCEISRFDTLDMSQTSSLPGLEDDPVAGKPQYKLSAVLCEFTYEPSLAPDELTALKQRLQQKVKQVGLALTLRARELSPKKDDKPVDALAGFEKDPQLAAWRAIIPFLPWFMAGILICLITLTIIWALRKLGMVSRRTPGALTRASDFLGVAEGSDAQPSVHMLVTRMAQTQTELAANSHLVEQTLKQYFDQENYDEICRFVKHFGPDLLQPFKHKTEYQDALGKLSSRFKEMEMEDSPADTWKFLDRIERMMTSVKVRFDHQPLEDEFRFLVALDVDEFVGLLRDLSEKEAIAAIAYAPRALREKFFAKANPAFTAKFIEQLTQVESLQDSFVRETARKIRGAYSEQGDSLRSIKVDKMPLLEEAINSLEPDKRKSLFLSLGRDNPEFVHAMAPEIFLDESLLHFPADILTEAFLETSPEEAAAYLEQYEWGTDVLGRLNPRLRESIKMRMNSGKKNQSALVSLARHKISEFVKRKDKGGAIDLRSINAKLIN